MNILKDTPHEALTVMGISESEYFDACASFGITTPKLVTVEKMDEWLHFLEYPETGKSFFIRNVRLTVRSLSSWEGVRSDVKAELQGVACL